MKYVYKIKRGFSVKKPDGKFKLFSFVKYGEKAEIEAKRFCKKAYKKANIKLNKYPIHKLEKEDGVRGIYVIEVGNYKYLCLKFRNRLIKRLSLQKYEYDKAYDILYTRLLKLRRKYYGKVDES